MREGEYRDAEQQMYLLERFTVCEGAYGCRVRQKVTMANVTIAALWYHHCCHGYFWLYFGRKKHSDLMFPMSFCHLGSKWTSWTEHHQNLRKTRIGIWRLHPGWAEHQPHWLSNVCRGVFQRWGTGSSSGVDLLHHREGLLAQQLTQEIPPFLQPDFLSTWRCSWVEESARGRLQPYLDVSPKGVEIKEGAQLAAVLVALPLHLAHDHNVPAQQPHFCPHVDAINDFANVEVCCFPCRNKIHFQSYSASAAGFPLCFLWWGWLIMKRALESAKTVGWLLKRRKAGAQVSLYILLRHLQQRKWDFWSEVAPVSQGAKPTGC